MKKLDRIKMALDAEVIDYIEDCDCFDSYFSDDAEFEITIDGVEYSATVSIEAHFRLTKEYETDEYGNRYNMGTSKELRDYNFDIVDLYDWENECYLIEGKKMSKELEEAA